MYCHTFSVLLGVPKREKMHAVRVRRYQAVAEVSFPVLKNTSAFLESFQSTSVVTMTVYILDDIVSFPGTESGEWLSLANCNFGQGTFTTGSAKPGQKQCHRIFFISSDFFCLCEEFCSRHPKWSWETHPQEKELLTGILFICFCGLWLTHCVLSYILKSPRELKSGANTVYHDLTLMVFSFLTFMWP